LFTIKERIMVECEWKQWKPEDMGTWDTSCGEAHSFIEEGIEENGYIYCPYCGNPIKEVTE
jgi:hypothetical protein